MGRSGRKRKLGKRHPGGELVREDKRPDDKVRMSRQPHRRAVKDRDRLSEKAESPLGRLNLNGKITDDEYEAGQRYAVVVGQYRSVIESPKSTSGSGRRGTGCGGACPLLTELFGADKVLCHCLEAKQRYDAAYAAVLGVRASAPAAEITTPLALAMARARATKCILPLQDQRAARAVARMAVHREELPREDLVHLVRGLRSLARHFGLTGRRAREYSSNAH